MSVEPIICFFNSVPEYVGEGVLKGVLTIVSALIVGWITARYFMRRDELTRIEGMLLEKKIPIYEHISQQLTGMNELWALDPAYGQPMVEMLKRHGVEPSGPLQIHKMLLDPETFRTSFLAFEKYTIEHKLYFDEHTTLPILVFTNYLAAINRMGVHFEQELVKLGVKTDNEVKKVEKHLYVTIGLLLREDMAAQIEKVDAAVMTSIQHLDFDHRKQPKYDYQMFRDPNGPLMKAMAETEFVKKNAVINEIIQDYILVVAAAKHVRV